MDTTISLVSVGRVTPFTDFPRGGEGRQPPFAQGAILQGLISGKTPEGQFLIDLQGQQFIAATKIPLQVGQKLDLQVLETTPTVMLRNVSEALPISQQIGKSLYLLDSQNNLVPLLQLLAPEIMESPMLSENSQSVFQLFSSLVEQESPEQLNGRELRQFFSAIGLNFERLLQEGKTDQARATLKNVAQEIIENPGGNEKVRDQASKLLHTLQLYQTLNLGLDSDNMSFYPLPFAFLDQGFLLVEKETGGGKDDQKGTKPRQYTLQLKLQGLGNLRIDIFHTEGSAALRFMAEDGAKAKFLTENKEELSRTVTAVRIESVHFTTGAEDPVKNLLEMVTKNGTSVLDTRV